jgi:putative transposase
MALAVVADGKSRAEAAAVGLMDRQTLRDWVVRFNAEGAEGLVDRTSPGAAAVENGPQEHDRDLVRWRRADLATVAKERFDVDCHQTIGRVLRELGFSHISARPRRPEKDEQAAEDLKKLCRARDGTRQGAADRYGGRALAPFRAHVRRGGETPDDDPRDRMHQCDGAGGRGRRCASFGRGRDMAAWLGLTPRQRTTGGKPRLLGISKRGNRYLRKNLIHGARAVLPRLVDQDTPLGRWTRPLLGPARPRTS